MGYIIEMNDGQAFDGVYATKESAINLCIDLQLFHGHAHSFVVREAEKDFTMRGKKRIYREIKKCRPKPMSGEHYKGYREALTSLRRLALTKDGQLRDDLIRAWDELDTAFCCRVTQEHVND